MVLVLKSFRVDYKLGEQGLPQSPAYPKGITRGQQRQNLSRTQKAVACSVSDTQI